MTNFTNVQRPIVLLPEGIYSAVCLSAKAVETKASKEQGLRNAFMLQLKFAIETGEYFNEFVHANFNFINPSQQAVDISKELWKQFLLASRVPHFDIDLLQGVSKEEQEKILYKHLKIKVSNWVDGQGTSRNNVKGFFPKEQVVPAASAPIATPAHAYVAPKAPVQRPLPDVPYIPKNEIPDWIEEAPFNF